MEFLSDRHRENSQEMNLYEYFDRISIIHLPERKDRYDALSKELRRLGIDIAGSKVDIPYAPRPEDANGFPSRGVYGSYLSHLETHRQALKDGLNSVWVLEDDAIFSRRMCRDQEALVEKLQQTKWDICYFGHTLTKELAGQPAGLIPPTGDFFWAHCYAVHARVLPRLVAYLERATVLPSGHPEGGKLYIDAAFTLFRRFNPDVVTLVANPCLSIQKGCFSSLNNLRWYDTAASRALVSAARSMRDEWWRLSA
jgi:glycosyl transferase, family 25